MTAEEIFSSSFAAAAYLRSRSFPRDGKVYVVGQTGIQEELDLVGIKHIGGPADGCKTVDMGPGGRLTVDSSVQAGAVHCKHAARARRDRDVSGRSKMRVGSLLLLRTHQVLASTCMYTSSYTYRHTCT